MALEQRMLAERYLGSAYLETGKRNPVVENAYVQKVFGFSKASISVRSESDGSARADIRRLVTCYCMDVMTFSFRSS